MWEAVVPIAVCFEFFRWETNTMKILHVLGVLLIVLWLVLWLAVKVTDRKASDDLF